MVRPSDAKWIRAQTQRGIVAPMEDERPMLGHYVLGDLLGQGSMAEVFSGFAIGDHGFQKPVALKRLLPELASNRVFIERLSEELRPLVGLQHRNIVSVIDLARDGNDVYLIMELVYGPSLRKLLEARGARGLSFGVATYIVQAAALALEFAHDWPSGTIIHGDVSPSNILLTTSGEVCVSDFGGGGHGLIEVRSAYMAPEQARGEPLTPRSDVFSLGVVLYELLCGKHPFDRQVMAEPRDGGPRRLVSPRSLNPRISAGLEAICLRALAPNPRQRYQSMQALIDALAEEQSGRSLQEGAEELAQAILECSPHVLPRHPSTMLSGQSNTMTVRSLLRDAPATRLTPPARLTPPPPARLTPTPMRPTPPARPSSMTQRQVDGLRPPAPPRVPAASTPAPVALSPADSGARTAVVIVDERARAKPPTAPIAHRPASPSLAPITGPMASAEPVMPTAPGRPIAPVDPALPTGGYTTAMSGHRTTEAQVSARPARQHRWMIALVALLALTVMGGAIFAAGFYFASKQDRAPAVAVAPPPAADPAPPAAAAPPPAAAPPAAATVQTPPNLITTPSTGSAALPGEPPGQEDPSETPGDETDEPEAPRKKRPGTLRVQTTPEAWVTIGKQRKQAPGAEFKLPPGKYVVRLEFPSLGTTETKKVAIESRKTFTLNIDKAEEAVEKVEEVPDDEAEAPEQEAPAPDKPSAAASSGKEQARAQ